jgi:hypothetical protein
VSSDGPVVVPDDVDRGGLLPACKETNPDLRLPTDAIKDFGFIPIGAGDYRAGVEVEFNDCADWGGDTGVGDFYPIERFNGREVANAELRFDVPDIGYMYVENGPSQPGATISFSGEHGCAAMNSEYRGLGIQIQPFDNDGIIDSVTIDWGDRSAPERPEKPPRCDACWQGNDQTDCSSMLFGLVGKVAYTRDWWLIHPTHAYPVPGTYTVSVTVVTGKGTANKQSVTVSKEYSVTDAAPSPSPS